MASEEKVSGKTYYFHNGWKFLLADEFPMEKAIEKKCDNTGHYFYDKDYCEEDWQEVTLPHTFNDSDLFRDRIQDAGSGQKRTAAFYRKWFSVPENHRGQKVFIEFEGMRQTCYLYINGNMAGYYEAGTAPFGFDLTPWICYDTPNLIAVATDNTAARNIDFCIAETPNKPDVLPGTYLSPQGAEVPKDREGVGFFWNCNDFNPSVGGISRPVKLHFKPEVYLTLPLYSNLQTKGVYVYGQNYHTGEKSVQIGVEAEIRNESQRNVEVWLEVSVTDMNGNEITSFLSEKKQVVPSGEIGTPLSITPEDAYIWNKSEGRYVPVEDETKVAETITDSLSVSLVSAVSAQTKVRYWNMEDPYLYRVEVKLFVEGAAADSTTIETGFRNTGYDKDRGILVNGVPVWLTGYAQRTANEWAVIGIAPEWLKDQDAMWIRESNSNHVRFMHVAAAPADIRSYDRHGIFCTQPAGDKERENFGRQWDQRVELMRDVIIYFRNHPSILFWEAGNNSISKEHMKEMRLLKEKLDSKGGRFMGCRTLNTEEVVKESEYTGTMLNRHAARFLAEHGPVTETEYAREEAPRRIWDDFSPLDFDYRNKWLGKGGKKQVGRDFYDLTSEDFALTAAKGYSEFFHDRIGGASGKNYYSACAALCWTDSAQHGRQAFSENGRMSGRVDPVRIKKQNFDVFRVMQSPVPQIYVAGHWNYPPEDGSNYRYMEKTFNGNYWEENGTVGYRDPKHKTVYVIGSYDIARIDLFINGNKAGSCVEPENTFVFVFPDVDVTRQGSIEALGYGYDGKLAAKAEIQTAGVPAGINLRLHTSPIGMLADGADIAYVDVEVADKEGRICPLCEDRIDFTLEGEGVFLGGYNSGRFAGYGKDDSVIHEEYVYAECGTNRVFIRSTRQSGMILLQARMADGTKESIKWESHAADLSPLTVTGPVAWYCDYPDEAPVLPPAFPANLQADAAKYKSEDQDYCKILVNGQEPDTRGIRSVNKNGSIWGAVLCILERLKQEWGHAFTYTYLPDEKKLILVSGNDTVEAEAGRTHLLVNGKENLMDGEPYVTPEGGFVMEMNALIPYIKGVTALFDDKVGVYRIETGR
nr:sugar-binding domain-containing protein [uncultured Clostridium sp.]